MQSVAKFHYFYSMNASMKTATCFLLSIFLLSQGKAQIAAGKCKFLGNIIAYSVPGNFNQYWNQVSPENAGKWGSVESSRNSMQWSNLDRAYNHAKNNGFMFRQHNFVWGNQQPDWIGSRTQEEQRAEVEEWIRLYGERYPNTDFIDVVNEPLHAPPVYKNALGGDGSTGWDWVVWTFKKAREYCPTARLHINDYGILNSTSNTNQYLELIGILLDSNLIDGIGVQGHGLESTSLSTLQANLNKLAETHLPIYITEYDVNLDDDQQQYQVYFEQFPLFWEHPAVDGVTLWGYAQGQIWKTNAYLVRSDGSERPALAWLKTYVLANSDIPCYSPPVGIGDFYAQRSEAIFLCPNPVSNGRISLRMDQGFEQLELIDLNGRVVFSLPMEGETQLSIDLDVPPGIYLMRFSNASSVVSRKLLVQ